MLGLRAKSGRKQVRHTTVGCKSAHVGGQGKVYRAGKCGASKKSARCSLRRGGGGQRRIGRRRVTRAARAGTRGARALYCCGLAPAHLAEPFVHMDDLLLAEECAVLRGASCHVHDVRAGGVPGPVPPTHRTPGPPGC